jgi:hypothetical protein
VVARDGIEPPTPAFSGLPSLSSMFAHAAGIRPTRRAYTYLAHLASLGLVIRGKTDSGKHYYRITPRGLDRLEWLRGQSSAALQELIEPVLRRS